MLYNSRLFKALLFICIKEQAHRVSPCYHIFSTCFNAETTMAGLFGEKGFGNTNNDAYSDYENDTL